MNKFFLKVVAILKLIITIFNVFIFLLFNVLFVIKIRKDLNENLTEL
jgi:hypothetical protein